MNGQKPAVLALIAFAILLTAALAQAQDYRKRVPDKIAKMETVASVADLVAMQTLIKLGDGRGFTMGVIEHGPDPLMLLDQDKDGQISKREYREQLGTAFKSIIEGYDLLDTDKDGQISVEDFAAMGKWNGDFMPYFGFGSMMIDHFPIMDFAMSPHERIKDLDGDSHISKKEFVAPRQDAFAELDKNNDGKLSFNEFHLAD